MEKLKWKDAVASEPEPASCGQIKSSSTRQTRVLSDSDKNMETRGRKELADKTTVHCYSCYCKVLSFFALALPACLWSCASERGKA